MFHRSTFVAARTAIVLSSVLGCSFAASLTHAAEPEAICTTSKQKAAARKLGAMVNCHNKAIKKAEPVDTECLAKAQLKFETSFARAEAKGGCATTGDVAAISALVDGWLDELLVAASSSEKTVFISSQSYEGNLGGLAGADAKCAALASTAGLSGTYAAWLSTSTVDAASRFGAPGATYSLVDGTLIANSLADLTDGTISAAIVLDENGAPANSRAWTGTSPAGTACFQGSGGNCNLTSPGNDGLVRTACEDWTVAVAGSEAVTGFAATNGAWTLEGDRACPDLHRLYCMEQ
jgi:hypothetical protein